MTTTSSCIQDDPPDPEGLRMIEAAERIDATTLPSRSDEHVAAYDPNELMDSPATD